MKVKVNPEDLSDAVREALDDWANTDVRQAVNASVQETAKEIVKLLKKGGPYKERSGDYSGDWAARREQREYTALIHTDVYKVYNKKHYRLTHLLEKGHVLRRGGRKIGDAAAFVHIAPAEDIARDLLASKIAAKLEG